MNTHEITSHKKRAGMFLFAAVILLSLPATFYGLLSVTPETTLGALDRWLRGLPNIPIISDLIALAWFIVLLGGRFLCLFAFVLNIFLILRRETSLWMKLVASTFLVFALLGILLVESQARHVRH
jgi:hypothetical protein